MAMDILVTTEELDTTAQKVEEQAERYRTCYQRIYSTVDEMASYWQGEDYRAFSTQIRGFENDFQSLQKLMLKYSEYLRMVSNNYVRTMNQNIENVVKNTSHGR